MYLPIRYAVRGFQEFDLHSQNLTCFRMGSGDTVLNSTYLRVQVFILRIPDSSALAVSDSLILKCASAVCYEWELAERLNRVLYKLNATYGNMIRFA